METPCPGSKGKLEEWGEEKGETIQSNDTINKDLWLGLVQHS